MKPRIRWSWKSQAWLPTSRTYIPAAELIACQMANRLEVQAFLTHHTHPDQIRRQFAIAFRLHETADCAMVLQ